MKMGNLFWPVLLIIAGALLLVKTLLHINIPVFKVLVAVALVWGGISIISSNTTRKPVSFGSRMEVTDSAIEYTVTFDSSEIDLSGEYISRSRLEIDCVFGKALVVIARCILRRRALSAHCVLRAGAILRLAKAHMIAASANHLQLKQTVHSASLCL